MRNEYDFSRSATSPYADRRKRQAAMPAGKKARIFASMRKIWKRMPAVGDSTKIIEEDRNR